MSDDVSTGSGFHNSTEVRADIDERLNSYFSDYFDKACALDASYGELWAVLRTVALAGGKRLRPYMTVLAYECYGGSDYWNILEVALAEELLHLSLLVHDDIIDKDFVRHGVRNVAGQYRIKYASPERSQEESNHFASAAALLGGDLLLSASHTQILASGFSDKDKAAVLGLFREVTFEVAAGQHLDMEAVLRPVTDSEPLRIARHKTAGYSFVGPLTCGAMLAHAPSADMVTLKQIGYDTGVAFQLMDDLLGTFGDEQQTGKSSSNDLREGKRTVLMQETYKRATPGQHKRLQVLFGKADITDGEAGELRKIIKASGAKTEVETLARQYNLRALDGLKSLTLEGLGRERLQELIMQASHRQH